MIQSAYNTGFGVLQGSNTNTAVLPHNLRKENDLNSYTLIKFIILFLYFLGESFMKLRASGCTMKNKIEIKNLKYMIVININYWPLFGLILWHGLLLPTLDHIYCPIFPNLPCNQVRIMFRLGLVLANEL